MTTGWTRGVATRRSRVPIVLALCAATWGSGSAANVTVDIVGLAGRTFDDATLVGSAGEVYRKDGSTWRRAHGGGTAATIVTARGPLATEIWALGTDAPPYRYDGATWSASSFPMSGAAVMSTSGAPAVAVARRVMVLSQSKWTQLPSTGLLGIVAVWASGPRDAIAATSSEIKRFDGTTWKPIVPAFAQATERVRAFYTGPGGLVIAAGDQGSLMSIQGTTAKTMTIDSRMTGFSASAGAQTASGKTYLLGATTIQSKARHAIATVDAGKLVLLDSLPAIAASDRPVAMLVASDGGILVATREGAIHMRSSSGSWTQAAVDPTLTQSTQAPNPPATSGP